MTKIKSATLPCSEAGNDPNDHRDDPQYLDKIEVELPRYRLLSASDLRELPPLAWRIKGVLPAQGVAAVYGASASGKTFLALDMAAAISAGTPWFGCRVEGAPVVYVCLEGEAGIRHRVAAWEAHHDRALPQLWLLHHKLPRP